MPLSCSCSDDYKWFFDPPQNYSVFPMEGNRKRCSCGKLIDHGQIALKFVCWRSPKDDIEERIHGEEVPMADNWLCEECADLYFSFNELGYECVHPKENMKELAKDYADEHVYLAEQSENQNA